MSTPQRQPSRPFVARTVRRFAVPIVLAWIAVTLLLSFGIPPLEQVAKERAVSLSIKDAPAVKAMARMGELFRESSTDTVAMVVIESDRPLGDEAHRYYSDLIERLKADPVHIQHIQDFWGDPLTAAAVQSPDGKAVYVQVSLAGNQGEQLGIESADAVRAIVGQTPAPRGITAYVTGAAALVADVNHSGEQTVPKVTVAAVVVIFIMLFVVYRSIATTVFVLAMVGTGLAVVRGLVALLGHAGMIGLSTFVISILVALVMAAGTDYGIFFVGRYHEARHAGEDRDTAYFTAYRGVAHVILASGLTIAGATYCLNFTRLPAFQTMSVPCAVGMLVAVAAALTLLPAGLTIASRFGLLDPKRAVSARGWRRVGAATARWPAPIFAATFAITLIGLLALPGFRVSYKDRLYISSNTPGNVGMAAAERHFTQARMMPEIVMIESDHDMRNSANFLVLNKLNKALFNVDGVALAQGVTRPEGTPLPHTTIPFLLSLQTASQMQNVEFVKDRMDDMRAQADGLDGVIAALERTYALMQRLNGDTHHMIGVTQDAIVITREMRDNLADIDDVSRPFRNYAYWDPHCYNIPACSTMRAGYEAMDGVDKVSEKLDELGPNLENVDKVLPQLITLLPPQIAVLKNVRTVLLTAYSTMSGIIGQLQETGGDAAAMGQDFDAAKNDDSFYLPREVFDNPDFQRVMQLFVSPDGHAARFIITHRGDPATTEGIARVDALRKAAEESIKGTPLANSRIYVAGTAAIFKDLREGSNYDLLIAGAASLCLIFVIMLIITRSFVAAMVIVSTVVASLGASFGLSVLLWQHILGVDLYWIVPVMAIIILLAVGSDYNLLLVARFKEEIGAGLNTGIIRAMDGTGRIVTAAGLVFAFTMASMLVSDLVVVGQVGTTIGLGLVFDTLVVRAFMMPSIAALLGRWFWWPINVRARPDRNGTPRDSAGAAGGNLVTTASPGPSGE
ncbi:MAG TPA: RND family transporter [Mycobacterium sp.]|nr:RND family transporter [Mycobacterium sp.]